MLKNIDIYKKFYLVLSFATLVTSTIIFLFILSHKKDSLSANASTYNNHQIILKINEIRIKNNLSALIINQKLELAAQNKAEHMLKENYFSHVSPNGYKWSDFIKNSGYIYLEAGENLAIGYKNVPDVVDAWMNSQTHKENILSSGFVDTGVGYAKKEVGDREIVVVVQVFGRQTSDLNKNIMYHYQFDNSNNLNNSSNSMISFFY